MDTTFAEGVYPMVYLGTSTCLLFDVGVYAFDLQMILLNIVKALAVAGGAVIGFFGTGWGFKIIARAFFHRKGRPPAYNLIRGLGMIVSGLLVYQLWSIGVGGPGLGGLWPFGSSGRDGNGAGPPGQVPQNPTNREIERIIDEEKAAAEHLVQVRFLGGKEVVDQRFYVIDPEKEAKAWDELVVLLLKRQQEDPRLKVLEIVLFQGSVDRENPAVTRLEKWAQKNRLTPKLIIHGVDTIDVEPKPKSKTPRKEGN
jgi:hypothetical protein